MELEVLIILLIIGSTSLLLLILAACYLIRKLIKSRGKNSQEVEKVKIKNNNKNNSDIESKEKLIGSNIKTHILNEYSPNNKRKFLSVSLSEIPFIDEVYQSVTDLRTSKTCDAIVYSN